MIGHVGLQMLEGNCGSGASSRASHDLVALLASSRPERTSSRDYMGAARMHGNKVQQEFVPRMLAEDPYEDPILWDSKLGHVDPARKVKISALNRRGSITMRFADDSRERGWNRSTKVAAPAAVPETIDAPMDRSQSRRSRRQSQRTTAGRLLHPIYTVKQRLIGASYRNGRRDFKHLFKFYDRDNSGMISEEE